MADIGFFYYTKIFGNLKRDCEKQTSPAQYKAENPSLWSILIENLDHYVSPDSDQFDFQNTTNGCYLKKHQCDPEILQQESNFNISEDYFDEDTMVVFHELLNPQFSN